MIDLQLFCARRNIREYLQRPFSRGEYTYATDGRVAIRVARDPNVPENELAPQMERIFPAPADVRPISFPDLPEPVKKECISCRGRGYEHYCPDCMCECDDCLGTGKTEAPAFVGIDGIPFDAAHIARLLTLPTLRCATAALNAPLWCEFDGGVAIVMAMSKPVAFQAEAIRPTDARHPAPGER